MRKAFLAISGAVLMCALGVMLAFPGSHHGGALFGVLSSSSSAATTPAAPRPAPIIHRPAGRNPKTPVPLLIALHPFGSSPAQFEQTTGFDRVADQHGFVVAYLGSAGSVTQMWKAESNIQYISWMITQLTRSQNIDPQRVYVAGFSLGGSATFRSACQLSKQVAAFAVVGNAMPSLSLRPCPISRPVSALEIAGTNDPHFAIHNTPGSVISADQAATNWTTLDGCSPRSQITKVGPVVQTVWNQCNDASMVGEYVIQGAGHSWPTQAAAGSQAIWTFLSSHRASSATRVTARLLSATILAGGHARLLRVVLDLNESGVSVQVALPNGRPRAMAARHLKLSRGRRVKLLMPVGVRGHGGSYRLKLTLTDAYGRRLILTRTVHS